MSATEPVVIASLDICHSRPIAPTRRIALGLRDLPVSPAPGAGGVLLAGIVAQSAPEVEPELREDLMAVLDALAAGQRVVQPRVRHRFQVDQVGLTVSTQQLVSVNGTLDFDFDLDNARPVQLALGAVYAAASLPQQARVPVFDALTSALVWGRPVDNAFITWLMDGRAGELLDLKAWNNPMVWAMEILEIDGDPDEAPSKRVVQRRFRTLLREAHPDHGGLTDDAAARINDLTEARRILLAG
jgi:hypothetical protein